jgi:anti-sigma B factor antagonist
LQNAKSIAICTRLDADPWDFGVSAAGMSVAATTATGGHQMQIVKISQDMDAATMAALKGEFETLATSAKNVRLDLADVEFIDSSGIGGIVFLFKRLRERSLNLSLVNVGGQPLRLMQELHLGFLIENATTVAA